MRLRTTAEGLIAHDPQRDRWVRLPGEHDMLAFLGADGAARRRAEDAIRAGDAVQVDPRTAGLPFRPRSIRAFMLWESHVVASSRMLVKRFFPAPAAKVMLGFERVTGKRESLIGGVWPVYPYPCDPAFGASRAGVNMSAVVSPSFRAVSMQ